MQHSVNHLGASDHVRHDHEDDMAGWLLGAALFMAVFSIAAVAAAYAVLLIVT